MSGWGPTTAARPRIVVSRCLDLEACRYDGGIVAAPLVRALADHAELVPVCPELAIGLGVPRDPIRIVASVGEPRRLLQPSTARDLTDDMERFRASFLASVGEVDGVLLKSRSPSCGLGDVKVFASVTDEEPTALGSGVFAEGFREGLSEIPIADELCLEDLAALDRFLTHAWALARLRGARREGTRAALVRLHAEHKLLLLAHHEPALRELGPLVGELAQRPIDRVWVDYELRFRAALTRPPSPSGWANALMHTLGYFRADVADDERRLVAEELARPDRSRAVFEEALATIRTWVLRFHEPYLATQALLWPYPEALRASATSAD